MRANLKNGRLIEPRTFSDGADRQQQLGHEIESLEKQFSELEAGGRYRKCARIRDSLASLRKEQTLLRAWLATRGTLVVDAPSTSSVMDAPSTSSVMDALALAQEGAAEILRPKDSRAKDAHEFEDDLGRMDAEAEEEMEAFWRS